MNDLEPQGLNLGRYRTLIEAPKMYHNYETKPSDRDNFNLAEIRQGSEQEVKVRNMNRFYSEYCKSFVSYSEGYGFLAYWGHDVGFWVFGNHNQTNRTYQIFSWNASANPAGATTFPINQRQVTLDKLLIGYKGKR